MARSEGLEPPTYKFVACCSIQLSYDRTAANGTSRLILFPLARMRGGEGGIRTLGRLLTVGHLANDWFQPLTHLSVTADHYTTQSRRAPSTAKLTWRRMRRSRRRLLDDFRNDDGFSPHGAPRQKRVDTGNAACRDDKHHER